MKKAPQRKCIGCKESFDKKSLLRMVKDGEQNITFDPTGKKNGRGAYLCKKQSCLESAFKKRQLDYSFQCKVQEDVYEQLKKELVYYVE